MNELIEVKNHDLLMQAVNARDLWIYIDSKQEFSAWIKNRIEQYGFVSGIDFITIDKVINRQKLCEFVISLDMAKELAMVERNEKGKEARRYFIECEKKLKNANAPTILDYAKALLESDALLQEERRLRTDERENNKALAQLMNLSNKEEDAKDNHWAACRILKLINKS